MTALFVTVKDYDTIPNGQYYTGYIEDKTAMTTIYTGSKLTYDGTTYDPDSGRPVEINEIRDDYYNRHHIKYRLAISKAARSSGSSAPSITAVRNGTNPASATDYSGGIYGLIFRASAAYSGFTGVQVDGKALDKSSYTAEDNGGTEVYLKAVYLRTLAAGRHTLTVQSAWGDMTAEFTVGGVMTAPKTFDAGIALYAGMAAGGGQREGKAQLQCKLRTSYVQVMYILYAFPLAFFSIVWHNGGIRAMQRKFVPLRCARESAGT